MNQSWMVNTKLNNGWSYNIWADVRLTRMTAYVLGACVMASNVALGSDSVDQKIEQQTKKASKWQTDSMLMPLNVGLNLNGKYVGQVDAKVDPRSSNGVVEKERFTAMLKPLLGRKLFNDLIESLVGKTDFVTFDAAQELGLNVEFDSLSLSLNVTTSASDLETQNFALKSRSTSPNPDLYMAPSTITAGVNIAASQVLVQQGGERQMQDAQVALNGLINVGGFGGLTVEGGARYSGGNDDPWERTNIIASKDFFDSAVRLSAGEITPRTRAFQGAQRMLGLGLHRSYSAIRPFQIVRPTGRSRFSIDEESKIDIYVNDILVETIDLPKGSYSLSDFPITSESNDNGLLSARYKRSSLGWCNFASQRNGSTSWSTNDLRNRLRIV